MEVGKNVFLDDQGVDRRLDENFGESRSSKRDLILQLLEDKGECCGRHGNGNIEPVRGPSLSKFWS